MNEHTDPVTSTYGSTDDNAPLVVLLHGRGSNDEDIISIAPHLPIGPRYVAVRAPIAEGGGFAWFANRGIGRPIASSLESTMAWFRSWLDSVSSAGRPVILVGFSGGAAFAGGLALDDPARYAGAAILYGTLPFDAGVPVDAGRLAHLPIFIAQGDGDRVIPAELLSRTWEYVTSESGAPADAHRDPGGHGLSAPIVSALGEWIASRVHFIASRPVPTPGPRSDVDWPTVTGGRLSARRGGHPRVSWSIPQQQLSETPPAALQERLLHDIAVLPGVAVGPSHISVPGARALTIADGAAVSENFLVPSAREFAHLHPSYDGSLHLVLPADQAADLVAHGRGRMHPLAGTRLAVGFVMVYGPRDEDEVQLIGQIVEASYVFATNGAASSGLAFNAAGADA
ncbi:luciferase domain-containing protein [Rhodococcoides fascians]|uniref:luciferase domain-containing protein n=1 Tax=Rhodococcoides fascians TaxID=1828 RepID=UPI00068A304A|nr:MULTISPECIES: luciferase family protein [Rhodococcus]OZE95451.1 phospholipase [Rhodococcus sp. 15-1189-1-1a]OZF10081.1 phospholipase [Rhodococcus sp. 14-2686-1-2]